MGGRLAFFHGTKNMYDGHGMYLDGWMFVIGVKEDLASVLFWF